MDSDLLEVKDIIEKNLSIVTSLCSEGGTPKTLRGLQHFLSLRFSDQKLQSRYENIMSYAISAEKRCPGAGISFLRRFAGKEKSSVPEIPKNKEEIIDLLEGQGYQKIATEMLKSVLDLASKDSKIALKSSSSNEPYVELTSGYTFDLVPLIKSELNSPKCKVFCIDGYIESVSEIHHLLQTLAESRDPSLMCTRGMSEDVVHTIKRNNDSGLMNLHPYLIPFDVKNVNVMVDLAVVSGVDVTSSLKGQLISSIDARSCPTVDHISTFGRKITIKNSRSSARVSQHIKSIIEKIDDRPEIESILSERLRSLASTCIDVCVPRGINHRSTFQQLDEGIRIISAVILGKYDPMYAVEEAMSSYESTSKNVFTISCP